MAKGKVSKRKGYVSKGSVGKDKQILKSVRNSADYLTRYNRAMKAWAKGGTQTPKILRRSLGVSASTTYRDWVRNDNVN